MFDFFFGGAFVDLRMDGSSYGMLAEGDYGQLSFQGTRYLGCVRKAFQGAVQ